MTQIQAAVFKVCSHTYTHIHHNLKGKVLWTDCVCTCVPDTYAPRYTRSHTDRHRDADQCAPGCIVRHIPAPTHTIVHMFPLSPTHTVTSSHWASHAGTETGRSNHTAISQGTKRLTQGLQSTGLGSATRAKASSTSSLSHVPTVLNSQPKWTPGLKEEMVLPDLREAAKLGSSLDWPPPPAAPSSFPHWQQREKKNLLSDREADIRESLKDREGERHGGNGESGERGCERNGDRDREREEKDGNLEILLKERIDGRNKVGEEGETGRRQRWGGGDKVGKELRRGRQKKKEGKWGREGRWERKQMGQGERCWGASLPLTPRFWGRSQRPEAKTGALSGNRR